MENSSIADSNQIHASMEYEPTDIDDQDGDGGRVAPSSVDAVSLARQSKWQSFRYWLWGYDFFISYHWDSGGQYAVALAQRLREEGFDVFLDRADYASGDDWKKIGQIALRNTRRLVLVATNEAVFQSRSVEHEVVTFSARSSQIVPICFGYTLNSNAEAPDGYLNEVWKRIRGTTLGIPESVIVSLDTIRHRNPQWSASSRPNKPSCDQTIPAKPSQRVIKELVRTHHVLRRRSLRSRIVAFSLTVLTIFAVIASVSWWRERQANSRVVAQLVKSHIQSSETHMRNGDHCYALPYALQALRADSIGSDSHRARVNALQSQAPVPLAFLPNEAEITHIASSMDGRQVLCTDVSGRTMVWSSPSGNHLATLQHDSPVLYGSFSFDGSLIVTASDDFTARLWDWKKGTYRILALDLKIRRVWFAPDDTVVTAVIGTSIESFVTTWEIAADVIRKKAQCRIPSARGGVISNDRRMLAVISGGTPTPEAFVRIHIVDLRTHKLRSIPITAAASLDDFRFTDDSEWLFATGHGRIYAWNTRTGKPATAANGEGLSQSESDMLQPLVISRYLSDDVRIALVKPDDPQVFATAHIDGTLRMTQIGEQPHVVIPAKGAIRSIRFDDAGRFLNIQTTLAVNFATTETAVLNALVHFSSNTSSTVQVYDANSGFSVLPPLHHQGEINASEIVRGSDQIVTGGSDGLAIIWDMNHRETGFRELTKLDDGKGDESLISEVRLYHDRSGVHVMGATLEGQDEHQSNTVTRWDAEDGFATPTPLWTAPGGSFRITDSGHVAMATNSGIKAMKSDGTVVEFSCSPDDDELYLHQFNEHQIVAAGSHNYHIWNADSGKHFTLPYTTHDADTDVASSNDILAIAGASSASLISIRAKTTALEIKIARFGRDKQLVALGNGRFVIFGDQPYALLIDPTERTAKQLPNSSQCTGMAFERHGNSLATFSADGTIRIWDARNGLLRLDASSCVGKIVGGRFSPDGRWLVVIVADHGAQLLDAKSGELIGPTHWIESRLLDAICVPNENEITVFGLCDHGATVGIAPAVLKWSVSLSKINMDRTQTFSAVVAGIVVDPSGRQEILNAAERLSYWRALNAPATNKSGK